MTRPRQQSSRSNSRLLAAHVLTLSHGKTDAVEPRHAAFLQGSGIVSTLDIALGNYYDPKRRL